MPRRNFLRGALAAGALLGVSQEACVGMGKERRGESDLEAFDPSEIKVTVSSERKIPEDPSIEITEEGITTIQIPVVGNCGRTSGRVYSSLIDINSHALKNWGSYYSKGEAESTAIEGVEVVYFNIKIKNDGKPPKAHGPHLEEVRLIKVDGIDTSDNLQMQFHIKRSKEGTLPCVYLIPPKEGEYFFKILLFTEPLSTGPSLQ